MLDTGFSYPIFQPKPALFQSRFQSHSARINAPSNEWLVSGSLGTHVYVWNIVNPGQTKTIQIPTAGGSTRTGKLRGWRMLDVVGMIVVEEAWGMGVLGSEALAVLELG